jgi:plasmid maintenance system antidote protein VapI
MMGKAKKSETLVEQLKSAIANSGLTTYAVAKGAGVPQAVLQRFVNGERDIRLATAAKLAAYLRLRIVSDK